MPIYFFNTILMPDNEFQYHAQSDCKWYSLSRQWSFIRITKA